MFRTNQRQLSYFVDLEYISDTELLKRGRFCVSWFKHYFIYHLTALTYINDIVQDLAKSKRLLMPGP